MTVRCSDAMDLDLQTAWTTGDVIPKTVAVGVTASRLVNSLLAGQQNSVISEVGSQVSTGVPSVSRKRAAGHKVQKNVAVSVRAKPKQKQINREK